MPGSQLNHKTRIQTALALVLCVAVTANAQTQTDAREVRSVLLEKGAVLEVVLVNALHSDKAKAGDDVALKLTQPLVAEGATLLPADSIVHGEVRSVSRAGKECVPGHVRWSLKHLALPSGQLVPVHFVEPGMAAPLLIRVPPVEPEHKSKIRKTGEGIGTTFAVILVIAALPLFLVAASKAEDVCYSAKGHEETIARGTPFYVAISEDQWILP